MMKDKEFDCVEMKQQLQRRLLEKWGGLSDQEIEARFISEMEASGDRLAQWWRRVREQKNQNRPDTVTTE